MKKRSKLTLLPGVEGCQSSREKKKGPKPSSGAGPPFRAYDRRELGPPGRALSRFGSIRLVDAERGASRMPRGSTEARSHKPFDVRRLSECDRGSAMAVRVNILCSLRRTLSPSGMGISPRGAASGAFPEKHLPSHRLAATRELVRRPSLLSVRPRRVVAELRADNEVRKPRLDDDPAPGTVALRVVRDIAEVVLALQLGRKPGVDGIELLNLVWKEPLSTGLLGELLQHVLRFGEGAASARAGPPKRDGVDDDVRVLGELHHLLEAHEGARVLPVRENYDRLPPDVLPPTVQVLERDVEGVVETGGASGLRHADRPRGLVGGGREKVG